MSDARKLPWGEKHLCDVYYTVRVGISYELYQLMLKDLTNILGIHVINGAPSKTMKIPKYIVYGVLTQDAFLEYLQVKENAQAKLLLQKAAKLLKSVQNRETYLKPKFTRNEDETISCDTVDKDFGLAS